MEELKSGHERMEKHLREVQGENKRLTEPLKQARAELANLQRQLASYEQDKITLAVSILILLITPYIYLNLLIRSTSCFLEY